MDIKNMKRAVHIKTGNIYYIITDNAIECTNGREDIQMVVYTRDGLIFTREYNEFMKKFSVD